MERTDTHVEWDYVMMSCLTGVRRSGCASVDVWDVFCRCANRRKKTQQQSPPPNWYEWNQASTSRIITPLTLLSLTLSTALPFVANGAHTVAVSAGAVAAAKRVDALCDRDVALGSLPAAVTHTGALVVLAIATAQHWAGRWRNREGGGGRD